MNKPTYVFLFRRYNVVESASKFHDYWLKKHHVHEKDDNLKSIYGYMVIGKDEKFNGHCLLYTSYAVSFDENLTSFSRALKITRRIDVFDSRV